MSSSYQWVSEKKSVHTDRAPKAIGPYSQAIRIGDFLMMSGQIPLSPQTGSLVSEKFRDQVSQVLNNMEAILKEAEMSFEHVIKTTVFLTDLNNFQEFNAVYQEKFQAPYPARSTVEVSALPKGALIEIEAIACQTKVL